MACNNLNNLHVYKFMENEQVQHGVQTNGESNSDVEGYKTFYRSLCSEESVGSSNRNQLCRCQMKEFDIKVDILEFEGRMLLDSFYREGS